MSADLWWLWTALLGGLGATIRWGICRVLSHRTLRIDLGVLVSNNLGSLLLGLLLGSLENGIAPATALFPLALGFCVAITTWSTPAVAAAATSRPRSERSMALLVHIMTAILSFAGGFHLSDLPMR